MIINHAFTAFISTFTYSRNWSVINTMNGKETVSSLILNAHHVTHAVYSFNNNDDLFAIITFKERKDLLEIKKLLGNEITAEPLPKNTRLGTRTTKETIRNNKTFMTNNFLNVIEINN